ncbi:DUF2384 domain-containing protein [Sphingomonas sp. ID1715]|uniref:MbcA/ParS/Xre antitoxin family protein n=1 Tax=Sphingomonas sp. ID1715 TaxID=1656898 RepID=UPI0017F6D1BD|nr:MbcA/ParS/Xre antitoxin family protein [Sphingomonas sp. ID1715]NNM78053.1 DUF2384 domain-containing protein [Sphingomonas sp. ID1715]
MATQLKSSSTEQSRVLSEAIARIADLWSLTNERLGRVLGLSPATISRLRSGSFGLEADSKAFEAGQYLVRLFRSLDAMMGSDDEASKAWLKSPNLDLEAAPIELLVTFTGLARVCAYVDAHRARV